ncbi:thioredoxin [Thermoflavifilum thermophilum]|uniref:Thioredoxin n=1 Tax=Thermoflavifilum thermophilum TaxID=1393122 RepID=A0A1I7NCT7_9BACT|nr:thioredoxin [Thermoflavifilum thermophilum]SFV32488.1 thioredoxin [Thermoflavifilum thermophilum]
MENHAPTFSEIIRSEKPVLVDFFATWCMPCKMMEPILEEVKHKIGDQVLFYQVDVDRNPLVASVYQISGVPTLMVFHKGQPLWRHSGFVPPDQLLQVLQKIVQDTTTSAKDEEVSSPAEEKHS